ncbi:MAG: class I SAM-dependent methyltransferase [Alphaproteobacteria bacterium]|nr:class I SAM-dependent methyltransferase [Alphaproteobacteria bacterium]
MARQAPPSHTAPMVDFGFRRVAADAKAGLVRGVFDSVAGRYDLTNDLMSGGLHRLWKDALVRQLDPRQGQRVLDVAGGTGDVALRIARRVAEPSAVTVCDINPAMVAIGRDRAIDKGLVDAIAWVVGDAEALPLPDRSVDAYTVAFGLRNVTRLDVALAEARRVLVPGGRFLCLEFSRLVVPALRPIYDAYSFRLLPLIGQAVTGDRDAYAYLVESIRRFPDQAAFAGRIEAAGFAGVRATNHSGGVVAIHGAWRV